LLGVVWIAVGLLVYLLMRNRPTAEPIP